MTEMKLQFTVYDRAYNQSYRILRIDKANRSVLMYILLVADELPCGNENDLQWRLLLQWHLHGVRFSNESIYR
jgi:hypothetical protein